jgi:hypothetical protein
MQRIIQLACLSVLGALIATPQQKKELPRTVVILVRPNGMEPRQVQVPAGPLFLVTQNRSSARNLKFDLDVEKGNRIREVDSPSHKAVSEEFYDLTPGTYLLTEATHPAWVCRIVVTPN